MLLSILSDNSTHAYLLIADLEIDVLVLSKAILLGGYGFLTGKIAKLAKLYTITFLIVYMMIYLSFIEICDRTRISWSTFVSIFTTGILDPGSDRVKFNGLNE